MTSSGSAPAGSSTTTGSRPSTSTRRRRRSTARRNVLFGLDLAKREIAKRRQAVVVEGYTDVMAMHLAGRADGRRLLRHGVRRRPHRGAAPADRRRLVRPAARSSTPSTATRPARRPRSRRSRATSSSPRRRSSRSRRTGMDPCELRQQPGRRGRARPGGPPGAAVRVRDPLDARASTTWTPPRARSPRCSGPCRWSPRSSSEDAARRVRAPARGLDRLGRRVDMVVRRVREDGRCEPAPRRVAAAAGPAARPARPKRRPRLRLQREALKAALQVPGRRRAGLRRAARARRSPIRPSRRAPRGASPPAGRRRLARASLAGRRVARSCTRRAAAAGHRAGGRAAGAAAQRRPESTRRVTSPA